MDKSQSHLTQKLKQAKTLVAVGALYSHYKDPKKIYKVINVGLFEPTQEVYVIYQAQYDKDLLWIRTLKNFTESLDFQGQTLPRFKKI